MADANKAIQELEAKIAKQEAKANSAVTMSIGITVVLVIVLLGYFTWMSGQLREAAEPQGVADVIGDKAVEQIPSIARNLQEAAVENAPEMVDRGIDFLIEEQLPSARKTAQDTIKEETTKYFDEYEEKVINDFDTIVENHIDRINELAGKLTSEQGQKEFEEDLYNIMKEAVEGQQIQVELDSYEAALADIDKTLMMITNPDEVLSKEQESLKHLVAIIREITNRSEIGKVDLSN